ncbi:guanylate kinase [Fusarium mexicanum]|uniref:Guanylate kinase n=1 Tax=Fusarium mexicanum TaxID=751941 RepID=A0A8H5MZA2_9HYPO|nr:guanylate kinase [Fusarium mexicanum]
MDASGSESLTYHMSTALLDTRPIIISGPSGVGKGTLIQRLKDNHPTIFSSAVSHTTRQPRPGEVEGVAYFFRSPPEMYRMIMQKEFVEHTYFSGNYYGTSKNAMAKLMKEGLAPILDIEMEGVKKIQASELVARYVFLKPPSLETLEVRLRARGTEDEASIAQRLAQAKLELEFAETGVHDIIIVNDDIDEAYQQLEDFVFKRQVAPRLR